MNYRSEIDGLRALAVLPVILFHAGFEWFSGGFVGVDVFFVISGYLITTIIISELAEDNFSLLKFYERRARRILPALFFVMGTCLPFAWFWLTPADLKDFGQSLVAVSTFSSNILFWIESGYFATDSELKPLLHTWSLAVEEQYYIIFPLFLLVTWRFGLKIVLILISLFFVTSLLAAHWGSFNHPSATFFLSHTRVWELLMGVFIAFYLKYNFYIKNHLVNQVLSLLGFGMIIFSIVNYDSSTPFPSFYALVPTIGTALLILSAVEGTILNKLLSIRPIVGLGLISYSAYLWHQPVLAFSRHRQLGEISDVLLIFLCLFSILIAWLSWRFVERPFRNKEKFSQKNIFALSAVFISLFSSIGLIAHLNLSLIKTYDSETIRLSKAQQSSLKLTEKCEISLSGNDLELILKDCFIGDRDTKPSFAVVGDSHARSLIPGFDVFGKKSGLSGFSLAHATCFPTLGEGHYLPLDIVQKKCLKVRENILSLLRKDLIPEKIFISARWAFAFEQTRFDNLEGGVEYGLENKTFITSLSNQLGNKDAIVRELLYTFDIYKNFNRKPIIVHQIPEAGWNPRKEILKYKFHNTETSIPRNYLSTNFELFLDRNKSSRMMLDDIVFEFSLTTFDPSELFCNLEFSKQRCLTHFNGEPLYYDDDHLSVFGSTILVERLFDTLQ